MTEQITGAQSLVRSLESAGVEVVFGIPGGAILPALRPVVRLAASGTSSSATSRAPATRPRATRWPPAGSVSAWPPPAPARPTSSRPIADAYMDSVPMVAITGQVPSAAIGTDAFQEADIRGITMPITKHNYLVTDPADIPRTIAEAFHIASTGRPGPGPRRRLQGRAAGDDDLRLADVGRPAGLPAGDPPAQQAGPRGGPPDRRGQAPGAVRRRRRHQGPGVGGAARAGRAHRHPGRHHADGARRVPGQPPAAPGHARHARHGRRGHRAAEDRPAHRPRCPLRRPGHRQARHLRPGRRRHPRRHRPGRDRQEPHGRRADRGRLPRGHRRADRRPAGRAGRRSRG